MRAYAIPLTVLLFLSALPLGLANPSFPWTGQSTTQTWYGNYAYHTHFSLTGYALNTTSTQLGGGTYETGTDDTTISYSLRLYLVGESSSVELTSAYTDIEWTLNATDSDASSHSTTWNLGQDYSLTVGASTLQLKLYLKHDSGSYSQLATFLGEPIISKTLFNSTMTFSIYTFQYAIFYGGHWNQEYYCLWGNSTSVLKIQNLQFQKLSVWEEQQNDLNNANFIGFILRPWLYYLGNMVFGIFVLFVELTLYNKYEGQMLVPLIFLWLFGGAGGILTLMIPTVGLHLSWLLLALALTFTIMSLWR